VAKNATTAKVALEETTGAMTPPAATPAAPGSTRRRTSVAPRAGTQPDTTPDTAATPPTPRAARGTGAGAKAATGRSTRTSSARTATAGSSGRLAGSAGRGRAPAHTAPAATERPPLPPGSDWTRDELAEVRTDLVREIAERRADYDRALADITRLQQSSNDGAGDDQADAGSKTFEREQELSIANNRRDLLRQMERAMERLDAGTYGRCESCSQPIPKARLQAFPSATLCVRCKQREERR
jgi:RNA polymerase-binding protein DksA